MNTVVIAALDALKRYIPEGHGVYPNPEYQIVTDFEEWVYGPKERLKWHNPEDLPLSVLTDGRRFLLVEEIRLPEDAELYGDDGEWFLEKRIGRDRSPHCTYATKKPLPGNE